MRLTLRTMLAYLDDILESDDSADIGKKIEESEFATNLMHHVREAMGRIRLGAPPLLGKGIALDPNTVAEYLDNTLDGERVPEFEKVCLESDIHLAEVAACHQILTLVLGEPAAVEAASRERMYQIISRAEAPAAAADVPAASAQSATPPPRRRPQVPEYLREPRSRMRLAAACAALLVILGIGLIAFSPKTMDRLMASIGLGDRTAPAEPAVPDKGAPGARVAKNGNGSRPEKGAAPGATAHVGPERTLKHLPEFPPISEGAVPPPEPGDVTPSVSVNANTDPANVKKPSEVATESGTPGTAVEDPGVEPSAPDAKSTATDPDAPTSRPDERSVDPEEAPSVELGRYPSGQGLLIRADGVDQWRRLEPRATLVAGDKLLSLPAFRPQALLSNSMTLEQVGAGLVSLDGIDAQGVPAISIEHGRLVMLNGGKVGNPIKVRIGDLQGRLTFVDADATLALDVRRLLTPGKDPQSQPAPIAADLYATSGQVRWEGGGEPIVLRAPERRSLTGITSDATSDKFPDWIASEALNAWDERAATAIEHDSRMAGDRSVRLGLKELAENRRAEVASLAIRSCAYLNEFEPAVAALKDEDHRAAWAGIVDALVAAIARSPETAAEVRAAFEKQRGADGAALYRLLWSFSVEQLQSGGDAMLVKNLSHDALDYRVLSFWNLQAITGLSSSYRPDSAPAKQRPHVQRWLERLHDGKIVPLEHTVEEKPRQPRR